MFVPINPADDIRAAEFIAALLSETPRHKVAELEQGVRPMALARLMLNVLAPAYYASQENLDATIARFRYELAELMRAALEDDEE